MPTTAEPWSLTSLREKLVKIGAKIVSHGRYTSFQMAEVAVPRQDVPGDPDVDCPTAGAARTSVTGRSGQMRWAATPKVRLDAGKETRFDFANPSASPFWLSAERLRSNSVEAHLAESENRTQLTGNPENVG